MGLVMVDQKIIDDLREYLKDHYIPSTDVLMAMTCIGGDIDDVQDIVCEEAAYGNEYEPREEENYASFREVSDDASDYIQKNKTSDDFAHTLDKLREEKGLSPAELYKSANIDRRQYSRFMGPEGRHPSMNTVISFALALKLARKEFDDFLQTAGYALSNSSSRDVCIMFCLEKGIYNVDDVNTLLFSMGLEPLSRDN
jgi:hypothetical protein